MLLMHRPIFLSLTEIGICLNKKGMDSYKIKLYLHNRFECIFTLYCLAGTSNFVLVVAFWQGTLNGQMVFDLNQACFLYRIHGPIFLLLTEIDICLNKTVVTVVKKLNRLKKIKIALKNRHCNGD